MKTYLSIVFLLIFSFSVSHIHAQSADTPRKISSEGIKLETGYKIEPAIANLSVPTTAIFDGEDLIVAESGFANTAKSRILRIRKNGEVSILASEKLNPPVTGLLLIDNQLYISHKGKVSILESSGNLKDIVTDLPSNGDHHNNNLALGPDGKIYMGQGTSTNSAVVGEDNYLFGWLEKNPQNHEVPCKDITLVGKNFESANPLTQENDTVSTGAYKPFGTPSATNEVIKGNVKCGGSIVRFNKDGSDFELVAWGLRNPFGLKFDKNGQLWATNHGMDVRGSRSVFNDPDHLFQIKENTWYGWPEYSDTTTGTKPEFLWKDHPQKEDPFVLFDAHEAANGLAISPGGSFGNEDDVFIAMFGTFTPVTTGVNIIPQGFRVARVDLDTKKINNFAFNTLPGPSYLNQSGGFDRPSDVVFGPDDSLYVVDWGAATLDKEGLKLVPQTGVVWRIYSDRQQPLYSNGPIQVNDDSIKQEDRDTLVKNALPLYKQVLPMVLLFLTLLLFLGFIVVKFIKSKSR